ncbi:MAG: hypothetical protein HYS06_02205 [Methylocystis sp.]|nr:hypothetical protein [Methylocystis sp.]
MMNFEDANLMSVAGPAVLRLKLLEVAHVLQKQNLPNEIRDQARFAVAELRRLIAERPCVSLVDIIAKEKALGGNDGDARRF